MPLLVHLNGTMTKDVNTVSTVFQASKCQYSKSVNNTLYAGDKVCLSDDRKRPCGFNPKKQFVCLSGQRQDAIRILDKHGLTTCTPLYDGQYIKLRMVNSSIDCSAEATKPLACKYKPKTYLSYGFTLQFT